MRQLKQIGKKILEDLDTVAAIVAVLVLAVLGIVNLAGINPLTMQSGTLVILGILAVSILRNRMALEHVTKGPPPRIKVYKEQIDAYRFLEEYIRHRHVRDAVFIQYSCRSAMPTLRAILGCGATVTVYVQDENISTAIGAHEQVERITHLQKSIPTELTNVLRPNCLKLYKYRVPGSLSAIKINLRTEQILCMGWYAYEHTDDTNRNSAFPSDIAQISGHDVATVVVWSGTEQFDALNHTFTMVENNYQLNAQEIAL